MKLRRYIPLEQVVPYDWCREQGFRMRLMSSISPFAIVIPTTL